MKRVSQDGGRNKPSIMFAEQPQDVSKNDLVIHRLRELRPIAEQLGWLNLFQVLVEPWIEDAPIYQASSTRMCDSEVHKHKHKASEASSNTASDTGTLTKILEKISTTLDKVVTLIS